MDQRGPTSLPGSACPPRNLRITNRSGAALPSALPGARRGGGGPGDDDALPPRDPGERAAGRTCGGPRAGGCGEGAEAAARRDRPAAARRGWGPRASAGAVEGEAGPAARFSHRRNWSRDRSAARSPGCSTAGPFSLPTVTGQDPRPGTASPRASLSPVATPVCRRGRLPAPGNGRVPLQEPSRIFRWRRRRGDGQRRREQREAGGERGGGPRTAAGGAGVETELGALQKGNLDSIRETRARPRFPHCLAPPSSHPAPRSPQFSVLLRL